MKKRCDDGEEEDKGFGEMSWFAAAQLAPRPGVLPSPRVPCCSNTNIIYGMGTRRPPRCTPCTPCTSIYLTQSKRRLCLVSIANVVNAVAIPCSVHLQLALSMRYLGTSRSVKRYQEVRNDTKNGQSYYQEQPKATTKNTKRLAYHWTHITS